MSGHDRPGTYPRTQPRRQWEERTCGYNGFVMSGSRTSMHGNTYALKQNTAKPPPQANG
ncbi:MAG: hypothetical protein ABSD85_16010 [Acidimicrobiales bacterium]